MLRLPGCVFSLNRNDDRVRKALGGEVSRDLWWGGFVHDADARVKLRMTGKLSLSYLTSNLFPHPGQGCHSDVTWLSFLNAVLGCASTGPKGRGFACCDLFKQNGKWELAVLNFTPLEIHPAGAKADFCPTTFTSMW